MHLISVGPPLNEQPAFTPFTFPSDLVAGPSNFSYSVSLRDRRTGLLQANSFAYSGFATLRQVQAPVIPEPTTVALVAGGLTLLWRKKMRRRVP